MEEIEHVLNIVDTTLVEQLEHDAIKDEMKKEQIKRPIIQEEIMRKQRKST
ncbi:hypothetical protein SESBI_07205 [Sesbania bispinosa]|nr:hypothetical protein SESBI_07205 [Sesbania bispinosa]